MVEETHEHVHTDSRGSGLGTGMIIGILLVVVVLIFLAVYGFNLVGGNQATQTPTMSVPDQIDVNVDPGTEGGE